MPPETSDKPDSTDTSATEATDKGKTLSERVAEYNAGSQGGASTAETKTEERLAALEAENKTLREAEATRSYRREMDEFMVPTVLGELNVHPKLAEQWLNEQADRDPRLREIWEKREEDRAAFEEATEALKTKFEAHAEKEGLKGTAAQKGKETPNAKLSAAVRSARSTTSEPGDLTGVNLGAMNEHEFALHAAEVFRLSSSGQLTH